MDLNKYTEYRSQMQTGDMIEWRKKSLVGWLIRLFSGGDTNHNSLVVDIGGYDDLVNRKFVLESTMSGVVLNSLSNKIEHHKGEAYWTPLKSEFDDKRINIGNWAFLQVGVKYDFEGLFQQIFGRVSAEASKYFCSEYLYFAYKNSDIPIKELDDGKAPRPSDMHLLGIHEPRVKL